VIEIEALPTVYVWAESELNVCNTKSSMIKIIGFGEIDAL
jgi:hypothetical protein